MLFEADRNRLERNYIIPMLEGIREATYYEISDIYDSTYKFVISLFDQIRIRNTKKEEDRKGFSYSIKNSELFGFIRVTKRKYEALYNLNDVKMIQVNSTEDFMQKYDTYLEEDVLINIEDLVSVSSKREIVEIMPYVNEYIFLMNILKVLKVEHQQQDNSIENILFESV
ncbi:hypothetical protein [Cohnella cholangitidis]|uniref:Short NACHT-associated C-terminal domain-containing protein n=1 Tax=Cohnella cholangitidis TaxID=2598458 RepID=A0A7G5BZK0_9BACL|nr:hypothetical protein [Cohnella cholangitidis]QMV42384.1 hypothetical protein FPL14_15150 [Cohnella cholangitidis]